HIQSTSILFPYTTLFRSKKAEELASIERDIRVSEAKDSFKDDRKDLDKSQKSIENLKKELQYWQDHGDSGLNRFFDRMILMQDRSEEHTSELQSRFDLVC